MKRTMIGALIAAVLVAYGPAVYATAAVELTKYPNCKTLNKRYAHGVGRFGARDKTSGDPVRSFYRNNRVYELNKGLDRDKDRIACEKA